MTYRGDVNILRNMGRVIGSLVVDTPVATVQDTVNVVSSLYANLERIAVGRLANGC